MTERQRAEQLKQSAREMLEAIGTDTPLEQKVVKLIYGFIRAGYRECEVEKGVLYES